MSARAERAPSPRGDAAPPREPVRVVRPVAGAAHVVAAMHPGVLPVSAYAALAAALPPSAELAVLELEQVPEYRDAVLAGERVELTLTQIAARFSERLLDHADGRPYTLLGWSFGGVIAYAVAELAPAHARPAGLVLLDSIAPGPGDPGRAFGGTIPAQAALHWFAMYFGERRGVRLEFAARDFGRRELDEGLRAILDRCVALGALPPTTPLAAVRKVFQAFLDGMLRNKQLQDGYEPGPPDWPVTLVRPERSLLDDAPGLGWAELVGPSLDIRASRGDHYTLLDEADSVRRISELVAAALERPAARR